MAFDEPVESDLVDLSSWGSIFVHTPVIGGLLHLLHTRSDGDDAHNQSQGLVDDETILGFQNKCSLHSNSTLGSSSGLPPALTESSVSVLLEDEDDSNGTQEKLHSSSLGKRKKTLSWSDQHGGRSLCEYRWVTVNSSSTSGNSHNLQALGNVQDDQSEETVKSANVAPADRPLPTATDETCSSSTNTISSQPVMTRSRSVRKRLEQPASSSSHKKKHQYIPRMDRRKNELIMPTYGNAAPQMSATGEYSPQYGFYVNLTPPSPGMYASSTTSMASTAASSTAASEESPTIRQRGPLQPQRPPNPIFQGLVLRQQQQQYAKSRTTETSCFPSAPL